MGQSQGVHRRGFSGGKDWNGDPWTGAGGMFWADTVPQSSTTRAMNIGAMCGIRCEVLISAIRLRRSSLHMPSWSVNNHLVCIYSVHYWPAGPGHSWQNLLPSCRSGQCFGLCTDLVSTPWFANLKPVACRSMCGCTWAVFEALLSSRMWCKQLLR